MKTRLTLNRYLLLLLTATILLSCSHIKEPVLKGIDNVEAKGLGLNQPNILFHLSYFNPNRFGVHLKDAEGDAWIEDNFLGHFKMDSSIKITGHSDFSVPVHLVVDMKNAMKNAATLLFKPEVNLKIDGKAKIGKGGIFIPYPIHYEGKQDLSKLIQ